MKFFFTVLIIFILGSCRFIGYWESVDIQLPTISQSLFDDFGYYWELTYRNSSGEILVERLPEDCQSVEINLEKGRIYPLSLEAVINAEDSFSFRSKPAGFLYPYDRREEARGFFAWEMGFLSDFLLQAGSALDLEKINLPRLMNEAEDKALGSSMWNLDSQVLLEELVSGDFSVYDIRLKRARTISLHLPVGSWINEDFCGDSLYSESPLIAVQAELYKGESRFAHSSGSVLHVFVESDGTYDYIIH